ncbi:HD domain-containing phosphohydrolase [Oceanithermus profundus]|uniref:HD domain-containing phosphohydrolase n=1 Tax=Oceanithermus profundus TaxID=187137 RepID=UPI00030153BA|nr:HD domain-containing phosphohydrolase [Oceanithermus profundus]
MYRVLVVTRGPLPARVTVGFHRAASAEEAWAALEKEPFDALVAERAFEAAFAELDHLPVFFFEHARELPAVLEELRDRMLERYKTLLENGRDVVYVIDPEGTIRYVSPSVQRLGYRPPPPGVRINLLRFLQPEDQRHAREALEALAREPGKALTFRFRGRDARGRRRVFRVWGKNLSHVPAVGGLVLHVRDVTREDALERRVKEEGALLAGLVATLPGVAWQARVAPDEDPLRAPALYQSPRSREVLGYDAAELGRPGAYYDYVHPEDREGAVALARQALREPGVFHTTRYRFLHGRHGVWVWLSDTVRYDPATQLLSGYTEDVTMDVARSQALAESESRFRTLAETAPAVILMWQDDRLVFANRATRRLTGYDDDELRSRPVWEFVHPEDRELVKTRGLERLRGRRPAERYAFRILTKSGAVRWLDYSAASIEIDGEPAVLGVGLDVTEAKEKELDLELFARVAQALRQSEELETMMQAGLEAVASFFHAPAGAIVLYGEEGARTEAFSALGWMRNLRPAPQLEPQSLIAATLEGGRPLVVEEIARDPRLRAAVRPQVPPGWSGVYLPLPAGRRFVGALALAWPKPPPGARELQRLELAAETIGNAVQRASLRQVLARRVQNLESLRTLDQVIAHSLDLEASIEALLDEAMRLPVAAVGIWTYAPEEHVLVHHAARGLSTPLPEELRRLPLGKTPIGAAALTRKPAALDDLSGTPFAPLRLQALRAWPMLAKGELLAVFVAFSDRAWNLSADDQSFLETLVTQGSIAIDNLRRFEALQRTQAELENAYDLTLWGWARAVELRDQETAGHTQRVTELALKLGRELGLGPHELEDLRRGAILHDVGKLAIPDAILLKPGPLTPEEWAVMKRHPLHAYEWLRDIPFLRRALKVPLYHHERWDGSGYPHGLAGEAIPFLARIFTVADVFDALTSDRPYRPAWPLEKALDYVRKETGRQFDPQVVEAFLRLLDRGEL